jgi:tetratricopeptide (TPR) repeat protein
MDGKLSILLRNIQFMFKSKTIFISILAQFLVGMACYGQLTQSSIDKPLGLFFETKFEQALPLFEQISNKDQKNVEAWTWLAETYRRLARTDEAIKTARIALSINPCYSFAHLVLAQASYPNNDTIMVHVTKAIECDSTDPNAWLMVWGEAIR